VLRGGRRHQQHLAAEGPSPCLLPVRDLLVER
jgi:hypothetical protein